MTADIPSDDGLQALIEQLITEGLDSYWLEYPESRALIARIRAALRVSPPSSPPADPQGWRVDVWLGHTTQTDEGSDG